MADKVIIVDETKDEINEVDTEKLEEDERNERLSRLKRKHKNTSPILTALKAVAGLSILGLMLGMFWANATVLTVSLIVMAVSGGASYFFYK